MRWVDSDVPIQSLGHVWLSVTPWTGFSVHGFFKTRVVEWVAISSSRGSSLPRDKICVTCIDRWLLYHWATWQAHLLGISSVTQSCPSLCDPVDCSTPVFPVHHQLPELTQTHVHLVSDAIQPSHPLSSSSPPACTGCGGLVNKSCLTLATPMDYSLPGSSIHGIVQARILEWVAISFSGGSSRPRDQNQISCIASRIFTCWTTREALG